MIVFGTSMVRDAVLVAIVPVAVILAAIMYPNSTRADTDAKVLGHQGG
jgi:hypothetical protein